MTITLRHRAAAVLLLPLALAACSSRAKAPNSTLPATAAVANPSSSADATSAKIGVPFRNSSFDVTVTKVATNVQQLDIDDVAKSRGLKPWTPKNGQFIVVYLTAKNVSSVPGSCSTTKSTLMDAAGKTYDAAGPFLLAEPVGQGLGYDFMPPGASVNGFIVFDVPPSLTTPTTLVMQADAFMGTANEPTSVSLRR